MLEQNSFTLYFNDGCQNMNNTLYPHKIVVQSKQDLLSVVAHDHVAAQFEHNRRKIDNFIQSDCVMMDIDNTHSDNPEDWISPKDIQNQFPDVPFYVSFSRNNMKEKNGKAPRPKFHVYFKIRICLDSGKYADFKRILCDYFPYFDKNATDAARFFYGVETPLVAYYDGDTLLSDFMQNVYAENQQAELADCSEKEESTIPEGTRNSTLFKKAIRFLTRWGNDDEKAYQSYQTESKKCSPPLDEKELISIWKSAQKCYIENIKNLPDYVPPQRFNKPQSLKSLKPSDYTDIGQTKVFCHEYGKILRYSRITGFIVFDKKKWVEDELRAQKMAQDLTDRQLTAACAELRKANENENTAALSKDERSKKASTTDAQNAKKYRSYVLGRRDSRRITATLREAQPMLELNPEQLDKDPFLLNTPDGTIDLRTGELHPHNPSDCCTKITRVSISDNGMDLFQAFLETITCSNKELENYLQYISGMCLLGKVYCENLIIAYGTGKNGKSTFFNLLSKVMGSYAGYLSSEVLISDGWRSKNKSPEYAELRGKRIVVVSELDEDRNLDTALVKKICSTDQIQAEKKYKDPFSFEPSHTTILCTNHLPRVKTRDNGTWRRLKVVPFHAVIEDESEVRNYTDYLLEHAGGAVLKWMVEGALKFIQADYKLEEPQVVREAIFEYQSDNDWLTNFISECCEKGQELAEKSGDLYTRYREFQKSIGESAVTSSSFKNAVEEAGFKTKKTNKGRVVYGLKLKANGSELPEYEYNAPLFRPLSHKVTDSDSDTENFTEDFVKF
ncbi:MAG: phage/plasmid primase, P4 family [Lachnospiraceae bacterium]|nr:phage/plasmid primase, P4 family [Lachnospiraceae bacterium]